MKVIAIRTTGIAEKHQMVGFRSKSEHLETTLCPHFEYRALLAFIPNSTLAMIFPAVFKRSFFGFPGILPARLQEVIQISPVDSMMPTSRSLGRQIARPDPLKDSIPGY
jgi:hypothetical protein